MKRLVMLGVLVAFVMILGFKKENSLYEFYDLNNNKGISTKCELNEVAECEIQGKMRVVAQYSEVEE